MSKRMNCCEFAKLMSRHFARCVKDFDLLVALEEKGTHSS